MTFHERSYSAQLENERNSSTCRCGRSKANGQPLCSGCYYSLTRMQRLALTRQLGSGYEEAWEDAVDTLVELGRVKQEPKR
jgi:hypothetical protein